MVSATALASVFLLIGGILMTVLLVNKQSYKEVSYSCVEVEIVDCGLPPGVLGELCCSVCSFPVHYRTVFDVDQPVPYAFLFHSHKCWMPLDSNKRVGLRHQALVRHTRKGHGQNAKEWMAMPVVH